MAELNELLAISRRIETLRGSQKYYQKLLDPECKFSVSRSLRGMGAQNITHNEIQDAVGEAIRGVARRKVNALQRDIDALLFRVSIQKGKDDTEH